MGRSSSSSKNLQSEDLEEVMFVVGIEVGNVFEENKVYNINSEEKEWRL